MEEIKCPWCGKAYDYTSEDVGLVTYWGEDGPREIECESCRRIFFAREYVERSFEVGKTCEETRI